MKSLTDRKLAATLPARPLAGLLAAALPLLAALALTGCGTSTASGAGDGKLQVVAAENFWGSLASQLGGSKVTVHSIIVDPSTDPHSYEPTASDAITMARSQMAVVNGIGYDAWASHLLAANPSSSRLVLNVGDLLGLQDGDNPHQWYSPTSVRRVIDQIVADYQRLDPRERKYFAQRRTSFLTHDLAAYHAAISAIRARYAGVPVGYSESIFQPLGEALGLKLLTPYGFPKSIAEGTDVTASDKETVDAQAQRREIKVWLYNSQNATPDVQEVNQLARGPHPDRDHHGNALTGVGHLPGLAGDPAAPP